MQEENFQGPSFSSKGKKRQIIRYAVAIYIVLSFLYILWTLWNGIKFQLIQRSFDQGRVATIEQFIKEAENPSCQPFSVFTEEKSIQVVNVACLAPAQEAQKEGAVAK